MTVPTSRKVSDARLRGGSRQGVSGSASARRGRPLPCTVSLCRTLCSWEPVAAARSISQLSLNSSFPNSNDPSHSLFSASCSKTSGYFIGFTLLSKVLNTLWAAPGPACQTKSTHRSVRWPSLQSASSLRSPAVPQQTSAASLCPHSLCWCPCCRHGRHHWRWLISATDCNVSSLINIISSQQYRRKWKGNKTDSSSPWHWWQLTVWLSLSSFDHYSALL